ncbi:MAG: ComEA family DNA-binding protein, partial [Chloroflexota bacterium]
VHPGVYQLGAGSRVQDAIEAAGGLLPNAYAETVNLAMPLNDGTKVLIPAVPEPASFTAGEAAARDYSTVPSLININTASAAQLKELPGIGAAKAQAIIDYRENYGPFTAIEQLQNVSGIGPAVFDGLKDQITVY